MSIEKAKAAIEQQIKHLDGFVLTLKEERDQLKYKLDTAQLRYELYMEKQGDLKYILMELNEE